MKAVLLAGLLLASTARAEWPERWTATDTTLQAMGAGFHLLDLGTTLWGLRNMPNGHETNIILGPHPSTEKVYAYTLITAGLHATIAWLLPKPYRTIWQGLYVGVEAYSVAGNVAVESGLRLSF